ncbi:hypothetical protein LDENG_00185300 [Lucifuga dentata]|nr:hypothetical protein LDENG_00185300 [Lucifuga dentata]
MVYNKYMGGVDLSDQLLQYYTCKHKTLRWYCTLFFHFLDIASTNAYILHQELCKVKGQIPMSHKEFMEELTAELSGLTSQDFPTAAADGRSTSRWPALAP